MLLDWYFNNKECSDFELDFFLSKFRIKIYFKLEYLLKYANNV